MSIYTFLPDEEPADVPSPQAKVAVATKQRRAYLFSVMEKVKGFVFPVAPHQSPLPEVDQAIVKARSCGYYAPMLGQCICGDPKNHEKGGKFYIADRKPGAYSSEPIPSPGAGKWGRCSVCSGIGLHMADCPSVGVTPR